MTTYSEALERAAIHYGIELAYTDTWGQRHQASERTLCAILAALGVPTASAEEIEAALEKADAETWSRPVDPVVVVREDAEAIPVRIPAARNGGSVKLEIQWEDGAIERRWYWLPALSPMESDPAGRAGFLVKRLPLPRPLALGYHELRLLWVQEPQLEAFGEARFIVCPGRALEVEGRTAGISLSLYALRSRRNWGCGDITDLRAVVDHMARAGTACVSLNPLHAIANRHPYNTSPYLPEHSLYRNFLYLDPERVPGFVQDRVWNQEIEALRATELVEYERVARLKLDALRPAFGRFLASGQTGAFEEYAALEGAPL